MDALEFETWFWVPPYLCRVLYVIQKKYPRLVIQKVSCKMVNMGFIEGFAVQCTQVASRR